MKQYSIKILGSEHTLPVRVEGEPENRYIKFTRIAAGDTHGYFDTDDVQLQAAIESSPFFNSKEIRLSFSADTQKEDLKNDKVDADPIEYPDVTKFREAQDVLTGEPWNLPKTSPELRSKEAILKIASELGVNFPNL